MRQAGRDLLSLALMDARNHTLHLLDQFESAPAIAPSSLQPRWLAGHIGWMAEAWAGLDPAWQRPVNEASDKALAQLAERLTRWELTPTGTEGYAKAEVTVGGVDTRGLSSQTLEAKAQPGLYFIGEVVDVTGWLGGYNFQWAWASAHACAEALAQRAADVQKPSSY